MPLNPIVARIISERAADSDYVRPGSAPVSVLDSRRFHEADIELFTPKSLRDAVAELAPISISASGRELRGRIYRPLAPQSEATLVWFHGGGWVTGSLDTADAVVRSLCARAGVTVLSVEYALAPEHPWPSGYRDVIEAIRWAAQHRDQLGGAGPLIVGGDSAGGNLAAAAGLDLHGIVDGQLLLYPAVDLDTSASAYPSRAENGSGYFVAWADIAWAIQLYVPEEAQRAQAGVSPIKSRGLHLSPPTIIAAAQFDPLVSENRSYAEQLERAGVRVKFTEFGGLVHGAFDMIGTVPEVDAAMSRIAAQLGELLGVLAEGLSS